MSTPKENCLLLSIVIFICMLISFIILCIIEPIILVKQSNTNSVLYVPFYNRTVPLF